jgi:putative peptidoglycan lipid II flippase
MVGVAAMGLNVVFSFSFSAIFARLGWMPHGGLALANSFATALEAVTLLILMRKRLKGIFTGSIIKGFGQSLGASLIMGIAIFASLKLLPGYPFWLKTISGMVIGGSVYAVSILIMRVPEFQALIKYVKSRIAS